MRAQRGEDQGCQAERPGRVKCEFGEHLQGSGGKEARLPGKGVGSEELKKGGWTEFARSLWVGRLIFRTEPGVGLRKNLFFFLFLMRHMSKLKSQLARAESLFKCEDIKSEESSLASVAQLVECHPINRKVAGLIPGQGTGLGC